MRYAGIIDDDFVNGSGVCVSVWVQGCPNRCDGCHNEKTWDFDGGEEIADDEMIHRLEKLLDRNGIPRNLSILGGEPLCDENVDSVNKLCKWFKRTYPNREVFVWTGYSVEELMSKGGKYSEWLEYSDVVIDGRYCKQSRDITLPFRGSPNQRVISVSDLPFEYATHKIIDGEVTKG